MQLSKGGKHIYGWVQVGPDGRIPIPQDVVKDYDLLENRLLLISGSRASGGFSVSSQSRLEGLVARKPERQISDVAVLDNDRELPSAWKGRVLAWVGRDDDGAFHLPTRVMTSLGMGEGHRLLCIRGSNLTCMFAQKGPLVKKALARPGIPTFR